MPKTATTSFTEIKFSREEILEWIQSHMSILQPTDAAINHGSGPGSPAKFIGLTFGATRDQVDEYLREVVQGLPPIGRYQFRLTEDGGAMVRWQN